METVLADLAAQTNLTLQWISHTAGFNITNKQTGLLKKEGSWTKRTGTSFMLKKRRSSILSQRKNGNNNTQTVIIQTPSQTKQTRADLSVQPEKLRTTDVMSTCAVVEIFPCNADMITEHLLQHCQQHNDLK